MRVPVRSGVLAVWLLSLAAAIAGCHGEKKPSEPSLYWPAPPNPLAELRAAMIDRDLDSYAALFADSFRFVFSPPDVWPEPYDGTWTRADELSMAEHLFSSDRVDRILLSFVSGVPVASEGDAPGTWRVDLTDVELVIEVRQPDGTPFEQKVTSGSAAFYLRKFPAGSRDAWKIVRWEDGGVEPAEPYATTWGAVKAIWR